MLATLSTIEATPDLTRRVQANGRLLHEGLGSLGLELGAPPGPIVAVRMPDENTAVAAWHMLLQRGLYVNLALPPGTPNSASLLRCSVSAAHEPAQIAEAVDKFRAVLADLQPAAAA